MKFAAIVLVLLGVVSAVAGGVVWFDTSTPGASTVTKTSTTTVQKPAGGNDAGGTTKTTVESTDTTQPAAPVTRSEAVASTLFGIGAVLILCGIFFPRISKVTFPGGSIELAEQKEVVEKTVQEATNRGVELEPHVIAELYVRAVRNLSATQPSGPAAMGGSAGGTASVDVAVAAAFDQLRPGGR